MRELIGAFDIQEPQGTVDFLANTLEDGTGTYVTENVGLTLDAFASSFKLTITNNDDATVYMTLLQLRGRGIYDDGERTSEAKSTQPYGLRQLDIDMRYQDRDEVTQALATFLEAQYRQLTAPPAYVAFTATTPELIAQVLDREPGDRITISESITGVSGVDAIIHGVEIDVIEDLMLRCRWTLAPADPFDALAENVWQLGVEGRSELEETTTLGV